MGLNSAFVFSSGAVMWRWKCCFYIGSMFVFGVVGTKVLGVSIVRGFDGSLWA